MIRLERAHLNIAARTHPGMTGKQNEDRFAVSAYRMGAGNPTPSVFAVVADGIGGHRAGELAAELAVNTISHAVAQSDGFEPLETLQQAVQAASQVIASQARDDTQRLGMGTTCACVWVIGDRLYTVSVGDSRIYLLRNGSLRQLTTDHTWVQEAIEKGILDQENARDHPNMHVIRRYLGSSRPPEADFRMRLRGTESDTQTRANQGLLLIPGDCLLLCSDGLTDELSAEDIRKASSGSRRFGRVGMDVNSFARTLISQATARGGHDNITVVVLQVPLKQGGTHRWIILGLILSGLVLLLLLSLAGFLVWAGRHLPIFS